jgi:hypothetical protein
VFFWSEEKFTAWLDARDLRATALSYWDKGHVKSNIHKLFAPIEQNDETIVNLAKLRITILRRENPSQPASDWLINPATLRELEFYRIMNANTAFQQIEQWMSGPLGGQAANPIATITDDKIKIAKHGFDKFSFRKEKGA